MAYGPDDPRAALVAPRPAAASTLSAPNATATARRATCRPLTGEPDERHPAGSGTWWTRSQSMVVAYTEAAAGDRITRTGQPDEHVLLTLDAALAITLRHGDASVVVDEPSIVVLPPGDSAIAIQRPGMLARVFAASTNGDLAGRCANASDYAEPDPLVAPWAPWPDPPAGRHVRVYPLSAVREEPGRFGRIFRCSTIMVNALPEDPGPRDPRQLSPHHHDDFEQISLHVAGDYLHHFRTPWGPDSTHWRDDDHEALPSPAVVVIPPGLIHTSQGTGEHRHWLIDLFAPPRLDFSERPGWVLNAAEYPPPAPAGPPAQPAAPAARAAAPRTPMT